jgi:peptide/nickel transport system permease protein
MEFIPFSRGPLQNLKMMVIPAFIMGMAGSGGLMRMIRTMFLEVMKQDYIRTAWSKGLRERTVIIRHAMKNAFIPIVTVLGMSIPALVGGAVIMEQIFNIPGIGKLALRTIGLRDYPFVSAINLMVATVVLLSNLVTDLTYAWLDPRVQYR